MRSHYGGLVFIVRKFQSLYFVTGVAGNLCALQSDVVVTSRIPGYVEGP